MKKIYVLLFMFLIAMGLNSEAQDTNIYYRFNNPQVVNGPTNDTLIFDVEAKSNVTGTYVTAFGVMISYNTAAFGSGSLPVAYQKLVLTTPSGYNLPATITPLGTDGFSQSFSAFAIGFNIAILGNLTLEYQGVVRYKMLVTGTGNAGIDFKNTMIGQQFYVIASGVLSGTLYDNVIFENDLLNFPTTPPVANLMFSELADPSDSNGDFIEIYNPDDQTVNFGSTTWFLTRFDGVDYDSVQLSGTIPPGETFVIGGPNFSSAYPGKIADVTASFVESNGTDIFYLSAFHSYDFGTLVDIYDASGTSFTGKHAVRPFPQTDPNTTFTPSEWNVASATTMEMTPGSHRASLVWDGSNSDTWKDTANWTPSYVPDVGHNALIPSAPPTFPLLNSGNPAICYDFTIGSAGPPAEAIENKVIRLAPDNE